VEIVLSESGTGRNSFLALLLADGPQCCLRGQLHPGVLLGAISTPAGSHSHAEHLGGHVLLVANLVRQRSPSLSLRISVSSTNDKLRV
jgi:hypothetical protein